MSKHFITLKRDGMTGFLSNSEISTDAISALLSIQGIENPEILNESDEQVELTYSWVGNGKFWGTSEQLAKFGLVRIGDKSAG